MIQENLENETQIRRFLLGELKEGERTALEEKFLADEDFFVQIRASEDDLIENYVRGTLSADEKSKFERAFLTTKQRRQRVYFTQAMLGKLKTETAKKTEAVSPNMPVWELIFGFFKQPKFAFGAAFAILALVFGFWFLVLKSAENRGEIAGAITPTPTVQTNPALPTNQTTNENVVVNSNSNLPEKRKTNKANSNIETPKKTEEKPKEIVVNPVLALFAGGVRSDGKTNELNLPKNAQGANLHLNLESQDYQMYRAEIVDADGNIIYRTGKLKARNSRIFAFVPAKNLKRGDYLLKLYGFNSTGEEESAADFQFRVNQK